jgi:hypothetical protein
MLARHFMMPGLRGDNPPFWYGFEYGGVHFTAISTEHDLAPGSPQHAWLDAELAKVDRCRTPWLVLLLHRPMYGEGPRPARGRSLSLQRRPSGGAPRCPCSCALC